MPEADKSAKFSQIGGINAMRRRMLDIVELNETLQRWLFLPYCLYCLRHAALPHSFYAGHLAVLLNVLQIKFQAV